VSAPLALRLARGIIRAVAVLVPDVARADWVREWHAELHHQSHHRCRQQPFTWRTHMALITRALGALPDAAWLRRQFTLDADAVHDAGHAVRMLAKTPGFTAIALLVFAVGIGAATAIVSIADALFMRPMAVAQPERVVTLWQHNRETGAGRLDVAPGNALDWMARARSFEAVAMAEPMRFNTNFAGREPDYVYAAIVGEQFFSVLGTPVLHGRWFLPQEYQRGGPRVVIMSHTMWVSRYAGDPSIVGSSLRLDTGDTYTVVGVLPAGLELRLFDDRARRPEPMLWLPKQGFQPAEATVRTLNYWNVIARLRPDGDRMRSGPHAAVAIVQPIDGIVPEPMATLLRLQHEREAGIAGDVDALHRIHLHGDTQAHSRSPQPIQALRMWRGRDQGASRITSMRISSPGRVKRGASIFAAAATRERRC